MKKRNKKSFREKDFLRLKHAIAQNWKAQQNLGWIQLDNPIHDGYVSYLVVREDIAMRDDAWVFKEIAHKFGTSCYAKKAGNLLFPVRKKRNRKKSKLEIVHKNPRIKEISKREYDLLAPQVRKFFIKWNAIFPWKGETYGCTLPYFYFERKAEKYWITHAKIIDEILLQEEAELEAEIRQKYYGDYNNRSAPKGFRKELNKRQKAKAKQVLYNLIFKEKDKEFEDNYKSARWLYW